MRAKFKCNSVTQHAYGDKSANLSAVTSDGSKENNDFATATPSGQMQIHIDKDARAADFLEPGKSYYLDFTEVDE